MNITRRHTFKMLGMSLALAGLGLAAAAPAAAAELDFRSGMVFTSTNGAAGNQLLVYRADEGGALAPVASLPTQGLGTGAGLGNQGGVSLSRNGRFLFVVNAQSNTVSTFRVQSAGLTLVSTTDSGGLTPISVTENDGIVYVLNAGGSGNVAGFVNRGGTLKPLAGSVQPLSTAGGSGPAQVGFSTDGDVLMVTEKGTNSLTTYRVFADGRIDAPVVTASSGITPFGFGFDRRGNVLVSEAFGGGAGASALSSYRFDASGPAVPVVVSASIPTTQTAACWVVVTPNGRYAYTTNTGSASVSSFTIQRSGLVSLKQAVAGVAGTTPIDAAVTPGGGSLFVLNAGSHSISAFSIARDGSLTPVGAAEGLPAGANGLAAN